MTQYNTLNLKLSNSQFNKLKLEIKNSTEVNVSLSSNVVGSCKDKLIFCRKLFLTK